MPGLRLSPADPAESPVLIRTLLKHCSGHIRFTILREYYCNICPFPFNTDRPRFKQSVFCEDYSQSKHLHLCFDCSFKQRAPAKSQAWFRSLLLLLSLKISIYISVSASEQLHILWYLHTVDQEVRFVYSFLSRSGCLVVYWQDTCRIAPWERLMTLNSDA